MGAYSKLTYHIVFSTKYRQPSIRPEFRTRFYEYMGGSLRGMNGHMAEVGGVEDHVHLLIGLPPTLCISDAVRDLKANASKWINDTIRPPTRFEWQKGYAAFTVSYSQVESVRACLRGQVEHHKRLSFQDEYIAFLRRHDISFELAYLFEGEHHG